MHTPFDSKLSSDPILGTQFVFGCVMVVSFEKKYKVSCTPRPGKPTLGTQTFGLRHGRLRHDWAVRKEIYSNFKNLCPGDPSLGTQTFGLRHGRLRHDWAVPKKYI